MLKEMYGACGIQSDAQIPPQTMTIERSSPSVSSLSSPSTSLPASYPITDPTNPSFGVDPTAPMSHRPVGPPPMSGFIRK